MMKSQKFSNDITSIFVLVVFVIIIMATTCAQAMDQAETLKEKAIEEFKDANYLGAIEYLQQALAESPKDADIHYYLGYFTHYLCYDSVPLTGFGREKSDEVLRYLQKAVELDRHHANAYYFICA